MQKVSVAIAVLSFALTVFMACVDVAQWAGVEFNDAMANVAGATGLLLPIASFLAGLSIGYVIRSRQAAKDAREEEEEISELRKRPTQEKMDDALSAKDAEIAELSKRLSDEEARSAHSAKDDDRKMRDAFRKLPYGQKSLVRCASEGRLTTSYEGLETMEDALGDDGRKFLTYDTTKDGARYILTDEAEDFFSRHEDLLESVDVPSLKDSEKSGAKQEKAPNPWGTKTVRREYNRIEIGVDEATKERITLMAENNRLKKMVSELECGPSSNDRETAVAKYETPSIELVMGMRPYVAASVRKAYDRGECIPIKEIDQAAIDSIGSKDGLFEYKRFVGPFGHPLPPEKYGLTKEWRAFLDDPTNRKQLETIAGSFLS